MLMQGLEIVARHPIEYAQPEVWNQWKKVRTKYRMLKALGMEHWKAKELACSRKGYWWMSKVLNQIFSKRIIAKLGYTSMRDYYLIVCEN